MLSRFSNICVRISVFSYYEILRITSGGLNAIVTWVIPISHFCLCTPLCGSHGNIFFIKWEKWVPVHLMISDRYSPTTIKFFDTYFSWQDSLPMSNDILIEKGGWDIVHIDILPSSKTDDNIHKLIATINNCRYYDTYRSRCLHRRISHRIVSYLTYGQYLRWHYFFMHEYINTYFPMHVHWMYAISWW